MTPQEQSRFRADFTFRRRFVSPCEVGSVHGVNHFGQLDYASHTERKPLAPVDVADAIKAPLLCHYGDWDRLVSREEAEGLQTSYALARNPMSFLSTAVRRTHSTNGSGELFQGGCLKRCLAANAQFPELALERSDRIMLRLDHMGLLSGPRGVKQHA